MSSLRRLAKDHATLRSALPPNYLFPPADDLDSLPDDLTQLSIHLTGSEGTPYSSGLWLLHLRIPIDYPKSPPKATFKTRIFHPNVEESSGAVCLETLKRDWDPKLTLKDILITISCLLIQPNPDSALNEKAGVLVREDYEGFVRQARLMTRIHAPIPGSLKEVVDEARRRGEDDNMRSNVASRTTGSTSSSTSLQKTKDDGNKIEQAPVAIDNESPDSAKENDQAQLNNKTKGDGSDSRKHILGKRPLTELSATSENEDHTVLALNQQSSFSEEGQRPRKSPKHTHHSQATGGENLPDSTNETIGISGILRKVGEVVPIASLTVSLQSVSQKLNSRTKYRPYARIGIKRL